MKNITSFKYFNWYKFLRSRGLRSFTFGEGEMYFTENFKDISYLIKYNYGMLEITQYPHSTLGDIKHMTLMVFDKFSYKKNCEKILKNFHIGVTTIFSCLNKNYDYNDHPNSSYNILVRKIHGYPISLSENITTRSLKFLTFNRRKDRKS